VALSTGKAGLAQFSDAAVADPVLRALYPKLAFIDNADYPVESAEVRIFLQSGQTLARRVAVSRGSLGAPLSDIDLENKVRELAEYGLSGCAVQPLIDAVWSLEQATDAGALMQRATGNDFNSEERT
jgi:2-methylcitrate dehydratase PrpD